MSKIRGFSAGSKMIPIAGAFILLLVVSILLSQNPMKADGAELYEVQALNAVKIAQPSNITLTNGSIVTDLDIIHVTADFDGITGSPDDILVLRVIVNESDGSERWNIKWNLAYSGSGSQYHGNITINKTLDSDYTSSSENLEMKGFDGDNISIKRFVESTVDPYLHLTVDVEGPSVTPVEPGSSFLKYEGVNYVKTGSKINFTFSDFDPQTTYQWLIDNNKITYKWLGGSGGIYNGTPLDIPAGVGPKKIFINATDRLGQTTHWNRSYNNAVFFLDPPQITSSLQYTSETVFMSSKEIGDSGDLKFTDCHLVFLNDGDMLNVLESGKLTLTRVNVSSLGGGFTIGSESGATLSIMDSEIFVPQGVSASSSILDLSAGILDNVTINDLTNRLSIGDGGVTIKNSHIEVDATGSIYIDTKHQWQLNGIMVQDTVINGSSMNPLHINNTAVWKPFDVGDYYYNDGRNITTTFNFNTIDISDPYIWIPHFIDSRSSADSFNIEYNNSGTWTSFPGYPVSNVIYDDWMNSESAKLDLSSLPEGEVNVRIKWNTSSDDQSCIYLGRPVAGSGDGEEYLLGSEQFNADMTEWLIGKISGSFVQIDNVSIENSVDSFVHIGSSGLVELSDLHLGGAGVNYMSSMLISSENSSVILKGTDLITNSNTITAYAQDFSAGDDWAMSWIMGSTIDNSAGSNSSYGIMVKGGWMDISWAWINSTETGIYADGGFVNLDNVSIESRNTGYLAELPLNYPEDPTLIMRNIDMNYDWEDSGIMITGSPQDYDLVLNVDLTTESRAQVSEVKRFNGFGALVLDLSGSTNPVAYVDLTVKSSPQHGLSIPNWPSSGSIGLGPLSRIRNVGIDGIFMGSGINLTIEANQIYNTWNNSIYGGDNNKLTILEGPSQTMKFNVSGENGIALGSNTDLVIDGLALEDMDSGWGIDTGKNSYISIKDTDLKRCGGGMRISEGSEVYISGVMVNQSSGNGLESKDSAIWITKSDNRWSEISNSAKDGALIDGGSLYLNYTNILNNRGAGIKLWNVKVDNFVDSKIIGNGENGLDIYLGTETVIGSDDLYMDIQEVRIEDNKGIGLTATLDPTEITDVVDLKIRSIIIGNNNGGDIIAPSNLHIMWITNEASGIMGVNTIGSDLSNGRVRANLDIDVHNGFRADMKNLNVTLLGDGKSFTIMNNGLFVMKNCYIRTNDPSYRFSITGQEGSSIDIEGGFLGQLYRLEMIKGNSFEMDGTLVKNSDGPIYLEETPFNVVDSEFSGIDGSALTISGAGGNIIDSKFTGNTIGVYVEDLDDDFDIEGSEFYGNNWGIYLFKTSGYDVNIIECTFNENSPSPIWTGLASAYVLDSSINPEKIIVSEEDQFVLVNYTLEIDLVDEVGDWVPFDLELDMGPGKTIKSYLNIGGGKFSGNIGIFTVNNDGVIDKGSTIDMTITYLEGRENGKDKYGEVTDTFVLDKKTQLTYRGYKAPSKNVFPGDLEALEDKGLKKGPVDVSNWFIDIGSDQGNLTYSATSMVEQISPYMDGSLLEISLQKDWNGIENITVKATDPHGKSLSLIVSINVLPVNDVPVISDPRIVVKDSTTPTTPRTGDTIKAVWDWYDVDGDGEPVNQKVRWYLNGQYQPDLDNKKQIPGVFSGQIWNYTVTPYDNSQNSKLGIPVHSPPVMVGNLPPTLTSVRITTSNPSTTTDLIAEPRGGNDTETGAVIYNYLWEKRVNSNWVPLGAPNSPILDHRFTEKDDDIRVSCWVSDGIAVSGIRTAQVTIKNSQPYVSSAKINPAVVDEYTNVIYITDIVWGDPDGDIVTLEYDWMVDGVDIDISKTLPQILKSQGGWEYPSNITVGIRPIDSQGLPGATYYISIVIQPTDTDGDGIFDDANGNGRNDPGDDKDDDNDGYQDDWEDFLGTDPKNYLSKPKDTDGDGYPDGDPSNSKDWMDLDDDNDGVWDIHPDNQDKSNPKWFDTYPFTPGLPGDLDYDGIGDDQDPDRDNDGVPNEEDAYPDDPKRQKEEEETSSIGFQIIVIILLLMIIAVIVTLGVLVYNGTLKLPTQGPPPIEGSSEAIYDDGEDKPSRAKLPPKDKGGDVEEMEEVENMRICSSCGDIVTLGDEICPNCGAMFELEEDEGDYEEDEELSFDDEDDEDEDYE